MKKVNEAGKYEFVQGDLSLMKGVKGVAVEIAGKVDDINFLCMSPGILSLKSKDDTEEGIDKKFALHFYSRLNNFPFQFIDNSDFSLEIFCSPNSRRQQTKARTQEC
jgi:hypothetical protein